MPTPKSKNGAFPDDLVSNYLPTFTIAPREARPEYAPNLKPSKTPVDVTVEDHANEPGCKFRRTYDDSDATSITVRCHTHRVRWTAPRCSANNMAGNRCGDFAVTGQNTCEVHNRTTQGPRGPRLICDDCGHDVYIKDKGTYSIPLHRDDHWFEPNDIDAEADEPDPDDDGRDRYCVVCNLSGKRYSSGALGHFWDHWPQPVEFIEDKNEEQVPLAPEPEQTPPTSSRDERWEAKKERQRQRDIARAEAIEAQTVSRG